MVCAWVKGDRVKGATVMGSSPCRGSEGFLFVPSRFVQTPGHLSVSACLAFAGTGAARAKIVAQVKDPVSTFR